MKIAEHGPDLASLQELVDSVPALIHTARPDGYIDFFNQRWLEYVGLRLEDLEGWKWTAAVHPDDASALVAKWRACLASGEPFEFESRVRRADGAYRWMLHQKMPLRNASGEIVKWYGSSVDIDDRKRAEEVRTQAEFYLAEGQRLGHTGSWAFDAAGFDYWSPELFAIHGLSPGGKAPTIAEYMALVHPEDREFVARVIQSIWSDHRGFDFTKRIVRPDGDVRYVRCVGAPVIEGGRPQTIVGTAVDVTEHELLTRELRRREAYLAEAQRLSRTGSFGWRPDSGEIVWSAETYRIFGYDEGITPTLDSVMQRVHPEDRAEFQRVVDAASGSTAAHFEHTYRLLLPGERVKHVHALARRIADAFDSHEFVGAVTDITERKTTEEDLRSSEGYLAEAQKMSQTGSWAWSSATAGPSYWSEECYRVLGFDPTDGLPQGEDFFQRIHPDDRPGFRELAETSIREKAEFEADYRVVHPDGRVRDIHVIAHPVLSTSGELVEFVGTVIDVTERKRAEAELEKANRALREREADLLEAQRLTHTGSWRHDVSLGTVTVSPEIYRIFAISPDEDASITDLLVNRIHPEDRAAEYDNYAKAQQTKRDYQSDYRIVLPDGSVRHIHYTCHPVLNESDEIAAFVGITRDVTEQVEARIELEQASARLRASEEQFRLVVDGIAAQVAVNTPDGEVEFVNQRVLDYFGKTIEELKSWRTSDAIHPDDRSRVIAAWRRSMETGQPYDADYRICRSDGVYRWFHTHSRALRGADGAIARWYVVLTDIEERKTAEQRLEAQERELRQILDLSSQLVGVLGPARERLYLNHTAIEYLGVGLDEWRQRGPGLSIHPEDVDRLYAHADRASSTGSAYEVEARVRKYDGSYRWFQFRFNPVRDEQGQITRWYWACTDIDDRKRAQERLEQENVALREEIDKASMFEEIVGVSAPLRAVLSYVSQVAPTDSTVLITGETGTGKELVARAIHKRSHRASRVFVSVNCAAIPPTLVASELFGHEKGAFTGAVQRRTGRFELADGGTIFLDEIGELPAETQIALLRVLQEREFERVGGSRPIPVDVRVIAATNRNLERAVAENAFRADLFYRLNVFPLEVPPLRDRLADIPMLVEYFTYRYANRAGKRIPSVAKATLELLQSHRWPGNIRELQNVVERAVIICDSDTLSIDERWLSERSTGPHVTEAPRRPAPQRPTLASQENDAIEAALQESKGRVAGPFGAAARLGLPSTTLESRIKALKIDKRRFKS
jgi:PAS domain S-box-containing protein